MTTTITEADWLAGYVSSDTIIETENGLIDAAEEVREFDGTDIYFVPRVTAAPIWTGDAREIFEAACDPDEAYALDSEGLYDDEDEDGEPIFSVTLWEYPIKGTDESVFVVQEDGEVFTRARVYGTETAARTVFEQVKPNTN